MNDRLATGRRRLAVGFALALLGLVLGPRPAAAQQDYPNRIIKLMQGFPPGGNVDIIARILGHEMEKAWASRSWSRPSPVLPGRSPPRRSREAMPTATP